MSTKKKSLKVLLVLTAMVTCLCLSSLAAYGQVYITGVNPVVPPPVPGYFSVPFLTPYNNALAILPPTTTITVTEGGPIAVNLNWGTTVPYLPYAYGNYTARGTFQLPAGVLQASSPILLEVTTRLRIESGREAMTLDWPGFNQPGRYVKALMNLGDGAGDRTYYYYVPTSYDGTKPVPLVFDLHGGGSNGLAEWSSSRFDRFAEKEGFIVVAPNHAGSPSTFVSAIIDKMAEEYSIDTRRVYATGISMGGNGTALLGLQLSDKIAAIAPLSGGATLLLANPLPRPMTVIMFGGTNESTTGGPWRNTVPGMLATAEKLVEQYHCNPEPEITEWPATGPMDLDNLPYWSSPEDCLIMQNFAPTSVTRTAWTGCIYGTEVIVYAVNGGGHGWPGGTQFVVSTTVGVMTHMIDATELMWEHFKKHAIPELVVIDIKPSINLAGKGVTPVAILSSNEFDATTVDPTTVLFGPGGWEAKPVHYAYEDANNDGLLDMILQFKTQETGIQAGDTSVTLTGRSFFGTDSIKTASPKGKK
jgi:polyhydroxybutyrate depolymerase